MSKCLAPAAIFLMWSALAQGASASDYLELNLEELLQVSIKGSTLRDESLKTVPAQVTVFTREQLDSLGLDYLYELLRLVPGFQVNRSADNPINYTFSASGRRLGSRAREVALFVDGRQFVDPRSSGADSAFPLFPLANIERVEIIQGPGSAIYGSGAFTGLINIVSRRSGQLLSVAAGSDQRRKADIHWNYAQGDWQANVYGHAYEDAGQGYLLPAGDQTQDPREELALDIGLAYRQTRLQFAWFRQEARDFYVLEKVRDGFGLVRPEYRHISLEQGFRPAEHWEMKLSFQYQNDDQDLRGLLSPEGSLRALSSPASDAALLADVNFYASSRRLGLTNDISLNPGASVQFGLEWMRAEERDAEAYTNFNLEQVVHRDFPVDYFGNFDNATVVEAASRRDATSAYGQWLQDVGTRTRLTLGARYDHYEFVGNRPSPRLGLVHQLNDHHSIKLLYGEAFRAPSFAETRLMNNPFIQGNPDLQHEVVKTWNLVWVAIWPDTSVNFSAFHSHYQDPIVDGVNDSGTRVYLNSSDQHSGGLSVDVKQQVGAHWLMRLSLTHLADLPDTAFAEADQLGAYILNYHKGAWNWNLSLSYQGERQYLSAVDQLDTIGSHWLANGQVSYRISKATRLNLAVKNITDDSYASVPQGAGVMGGVPNRGREWSLGVDWRW